MAQTPEASETAKKEEIPENRPWVEVWGKEPTYSKFYAENEYLASRGIRSEVLQEFGVGYYLNAKSKSRLNGHILFPIHNQLGQLVAYGWRTTSNEGQRYCFPPAEMELKSGQKVRFNKAKLLWNLHRALKDDACGVIVVEGFVGAMNLWQNGFRSVVALMGSSLSEAQAEILVNEFAIATFVLDPDEAGQKVKKQAIAMLLPKMPIKVVEPEKQMDVMSAEEMQKLLS